MTISLAFVEREEKNEFSRCEDQLEAIKGEPKLVINLPLDDISVSAHAEPLFTQGEVEERR